MLLENVTVQVWRQRIQFVLFSYEKHHSLGENMSADQKLISFTLLYEKETFHKIVNLPKVNLIYVFYFTIQISELTKLYSL